MGFREGQAKISQSQFAKLIGVNLRTLQNWEQRRTRPTGPARALLKIVASNPKSAIEALHALARQRRATGRLARAHACVQTYMSGSRRRRSLPGRCCACRNRQ
jgi:transcriptional regulator with XRE-family HTH domain